MHPYYKARADQIAADFEVNLRLVWPEFEKVFPGLTRADLSPDFETAFRDVLSALPYVGGDDGRMTQYFESNTGVIALGRVLLARDAPRRVVANLLQKSFLARLSDMDENERYALGRAFMSDDSKAQLRALSRASRKREAPGDFVYTYVEAGVDADGEPFEFGLDYQECGFCKLCAQTGDTNVLPMICGMDDESYGLRGVWLKRTQTLAEGASHCNFRYRLMPEAKTENEGG